MFGFIKDEATSALGRQATAFKNEKDWDNAIRCLREMKVGMWVSPVSYGVQAWCRLPLVLQQAGRFEEAEREFEILIEELPLLARKESHMDDPTWSYGSKTSKLSIYKQIIKIYTRIIKEQRELCRRREQTKLARLAKAALVQQERDQKLAAREQKKLTKEKMKTITVDAHRAFALFYELFKAKPWLNQPGTMRPEDAAAEAEAIAFLLTVKSVNDWGECSPAAQRIACSLILDFMGRLQDPKSSFSRAKWQVMRDAPEWSQALDVIAHEIQLSHPQLEVKH